MKHDCPSPTGAEAALDFSLPSDFAQRFVYDPDAAGPCDASNVVGAAAITVAPDVLAAALAAVANAFADPASQRPSRSRSPSPDGAGTVTLFCPHDGRLDLLDAAVHALADATCAPVLALDWLDVLEGDGGSLSDGTRIHTTCVPSVLTCSGAEIALALASLYESPRKRRVSSKGVTGGWSAPVGGDSWGAPAPTAWDAPADGWGVNEWTAPPPAPARKLKRSKGKRRAASPSPADWDNYGWARAPTPPMHTPPLPPPPPFVPPPPPQLPQPPEPIDATIIASITESEIDVLVEPSPPTCLCDMCVATPLHEVEEEEEPAPAEDDIPPLPTFTHFVPPSPPPSPGWPAVQTPAQGWSAPLRAQSPAPSTVPPLSDAQRCLREMLSALPPSKRGRRFVYVRDFGR